MSDEVIRSRDVVARRPEFHRLELFGFQIDPLTMRQAVEQIAAAAEEPFERCRYVVTPNVDHAVLLQHHARLKQAYDSADWILADGHPLVWASRLLGRPLPERVPGSDLVPSLFARVQEADGARVFLLGAAPGVADRAARRIEREWPKVEIVGTYSPPLGFERDAEESERIVAKIGQARPDLLVVGLGAPKQECWVHQHRRELKAKIALCVGATIDFLAGEKKRAPRWMQRCGVEWLHRMLCEPRRLAKRYLKDACVFPQMVWRQWQRRSSAG